MADLHLLKCAELQTIKSTYESTILQMVRRVLSCPTVDRRDGITSQESWDDYFPGQKFFKQKQNKRHHPIPLSLTVESISTVKGSEWAPRPHPIQHIWALGMSRYSFTGG